jgi:hypothetical protein
VEVTDTGNSLAYYDTAPIFAVKSFRVQVPESAFISILQKNSLKTSNIFKIDQLDLR